jgi:uncharacterized protein (TIGR03000 family)
MHTYHTYCRGLAFVAGVALAALASVLGAQTPLPGKEAPCEIVVIVPADAEVFFDGAATRQKGNKRRFVTPPLEAGAKYTYVVRASGMRLARSRITRARSR